MSGKKAARREKKVRGDERKRGNYREGKTGTKRKIKQ